ncbi:unnamed protein product [Amoebophrya sp. A25]|nr:unnamed protein product [Amoebophrya sp. A25]|eukprot:GSA25T00015345001.1
MVHQFGSVLLCPQNLAVSGANQVLYNIVAGNLYRGTVVLVSPTPGPFAAKFQEMGVAIRITKNVEEVLNDIRDIRFAVCNTIMTAHTVLMLEQKWRIPCAWVLHEWWSEDMIADELAKRNNTDLTPKTVQAALSVCQATVCVCKRQLDLYQPKWGEVIYNGTPDVSDDVRNKFPLLSESLANSPRVSEIREQVGSGVSGASGSILGGGGGVVETALSPSVPSLPQIDERAEAPTVTFLCLGIVCPRKNQLFTVKCFKELSQRRTNVKLNVVGVRRIREYEIQYVDKLTEATLTCRNIHLFDVTHEIDKYYAEADVVVLSSLNEVTPCVLAEAMARGKPVLTTGIAGIPEMVTDGVEGFVLPHEDDEESVQKWADAMEKLAEDEGLRMKMGRAGVKRFASSFRLDVMVQNYRRVALKLAKPVVLVDMDGVVVDWDRGFRHAFFGKGYIEDQEIDRSRHYEMERCIVGEIPQECIDAGCESWADVVKEIYCEEGFFRNLPPMKGAVQALKAMLTKGYDVFLCTSPVSFSRYCAQEKWEWVRAYLGEHWLDRMILSRDKTAVRGDILIDDKPHITGRFPIPLWTHVVFDAPYNRVATTTTVNGATAGQLREFGTTAGATTTTVTTAGIYPALLAATETSSPGCVLAKGAENKNGAQQDCVAGNKVIACKATTASATSSVEDLAQKARLNVWTDWEEVLQEELTAAVIDEDDHATSEGGTSFTTSTGCGEEEQSKLRRSRGMLKSTTSPGNLVEPAAVSSSSPAKDVGEIGSLGSSNVGLSQAITGPAVAQGSIGGAYFSSNIVTSDTGCSGLDAAEAKAMRETRRLERKLEAIRRAEANTTSTSQAHTPKVFTPSGRSGSGGSPASSPRLSVTADDVARMRDFTGELIGNGAVPDAYLKEYRRWRRGKAAGQGGEYFQALVKMERIRKQMFLDGPDWSSVHLYRSGYNSWRRGKGRGAHDYMMGRFENQSGDTHSRTSEAGSPMHVRLPGAGVVSSGVTFSGH